LRNLTLKASVGVYLEKLGRSLKVLEVLRDIRSWRSQEGAGEGFEGLRRGFGAGE
jgi:hypothetical protein